ncbi:MAG TPA: hypothetical protein VFE58_18270 [Tepidisphaeraceae bacterium]|nr:hypothetical protein [Tepidisphaeraceae bacterium]
MRQYGWVVMGVLAMGVIGCESWNTDTGDDTAGIVQPDNGGLRNNAANGDMNAVGNSREMSGSGAYNANRANNGTMQPGSMNSNGTSSSSSGSSFDSSNAAITGPNTGSGSRATGSGSESSGSGLFGNGAGSGSNSSGILGGPAGTGK